MSEKEGPAGGQSRGQGSDSPMTFSIPYPLESAIVASVEPTAVATVRQVFEASDIYALGMTAGVVDEKAETGTESDLLHFTIDTEGGEQVMLPVFTRPEFMREALLRNPDWQTLMVLQIAGDALIHNIDRDVTVVIDPWTRLEFQIPPAVANEVPATSEGPGGPAT
jgi:hypothetical protein